MAHPPGLSGGLSYTMACEQRNTYECMLLEAVLQLEQLTDYVSSEISGRWKVHDGNMWIDLV